jgi:hypothetical protein
MAPAGARYGSEEREEQGAKTAPERDQRRECERPGPVDEEFGEWGAPTDEDRRYQRTEDGGPVMREGGPFMVSADRTARVQEKSLRIGG